MDLTAQQKQEVFEHCDWLFGQHERLGGHISHYVQRNFGLTRWLAKGLVAEWQREKGFGEDFWAYAREGSEEELRAIAFPAWGKGATLKHYLFKVLGLILACVRGIIGV